MRTRSSRPFVHGVLGVALATGFVAAQDAPPPPETPSAETPSAEAPAEAPAEAGATPDAPQPGKSRKRKMEEGVETLVLLPALLATVAFPVGLAVHLLILGFAPQRGRGLARHLQGARRGKTLVLGAGNTLFFFVVVTSLGQSSPPLSLLALLLWVMLALVGSHGIARTVGARVRGVAEVEDEPEPGEDMKSVAVGWFVLCFGAAFPVLGLGLLVYWAVRATGGVMLTLFSVPEEPSPEQLSPEQQSPGQLSPGQLGHAAAGGGL